MANQDPENTEFDLFISYASDDDILKFDNKEVSVVATLKKALEKHNYPNTVGIRSPGTNFKVCTFDEDFELGNTVESEIQNKIRSSSKLLVICSKASQLSEYVKEEILFYKSIRNEAPLAAFYTALPNKAFPSTFNPDHLAANLSVEPWMNLKQWQKQVENESHKIVANVWTQDLKTIFDRFKSARRRSRLRSIGILGSLFFGMLIVAAIVQLIRNPSHAWTTHSSTKNLQIQQAILVKDSEGIERIRALGHYSVEGVFAEDVTNERYSIWDLDLKGKLTGCISIDIDDAASILNDIDTKKHGGLGTLEDEWNQSNDHSEIIEKELAKWLFNNIYTAIDRDGKPDYFVSLVDYYNDYDNPSTSSRDTLSSYLRSGKFATYNDLTDNFTEFILDVNTIVAFIGITKGNEHIETEATAFLFSKDQGRTWSIGKELLDINASAITSMAPLDMEKGVFVVSATDIGWDSTYMSGGVFLTQNLGVSWSKFNFTGPLIGDKFFSVAGAIASEKQIAVVINRNPDEVSKITYSDNGGKNWTNLDDGLKMPLGTTIKLVGISSSGEIIAWIDSSNDNKGSIVIWRRLNLIERIFQNYGISLGV